MPVRPEFAMDSSVDPKSAAQALDLDALMEKIRAEIAERKQFRDATTTSDSLCELPADFATHTWTARELLALPVTDFARAVHLAFFGREPSPEEFVRLRDRLLLEHVGRMRVLREIRRSPEARGLRSSVKGLMQQLVWDRVYWSPPAKFGRAVGRGARNAWLLPRHIREFIARMETLERRTAETSAALKNVQSAQMTDRQNASKHVRRLQKTIETGNARAGARIEQTEFRLTEAEVKLVQHWRSIIEHKFELQNLVAALRAAEQTPSGAKALASEIMHESSHLLDPLYLSFEDCYRGTRTDIKERLRVYVPRLEAACAAADRAVVVDIGCGRGEWLELLAESGIAARGFDLNRIAVEECRARGLKVELANGLDALAALASDSCAAVTAFHIAEHLPFESVVKLLDESLRVLRPNGLLIVETPNPANLLVAAERFYLDPTHRNPLPSQLTAWLFRSRGFEDVQIVPLHPVPTDSRQDYSDPMLNLLQERLFGPQDYGAIGRKSA
jgi:SAM-dependent methyltransferase